MTALQRWSLVFGAKDWMPPKVHDSMTVAARKEWLRWRLEYFKQWPLLYKKHEARLPK